MAAWQTARRVSAHAGKGGERPIIKQTIADDTTTTAALGFHKFAEKEQQPCWGMSNLFRG